MRARQKQTCDDKYGTSCETAAENRGKRALGALLFQGDCNIILKIHTEYIRPGGYDPEHALDLYTDWKNCVNSAQEIQENVWDDKDDCRDNNVICKQNADDFHPICLEQSCRITPEQCEYDGGVWIPYPGYCGHEPSGHQCPSYEEARCTDFGFEWTHGNGEGGGTCSGEI